MVHVHTEVVVILVCVVKEKGVTLDSRDWQRVVKAISSVWSQTSNPIRIIISFVCTLKSEREEEKE